MKSILQPHLPTGRVRCVVVDQAAPPELFAWFAAHHIEVVRSAYIPNVLDRVSTHPDMQLFHIRDRLFISEPSIYEYYKKNLEIYGVKIVKGQSAVQRNYPADIAYNIARTGDFAVHNSDFTDSVARDYCEQNKIRIVHAAQGYTKCATCVIAENAVITADVGLQRVYDRLGIDCLLISPGGIELPGAEYGFIGCCCGFVDAGMLLFCGTLETHPDADKIKRFLERYHVCSVSAFAGPLRDIGTIIPVVQE